MSATEKSRGIRLSVLRLAETLRSVSEACRLRDMTRMQFYEYLDFGILEGFEKFKRVVYSATRDRHGVDAERTPEAASLRPEQAHRRLPGAA